MFKPTFVSGNYVFVKRTPPTTTTAQLLAAKDCPELCHRRFGAYPVVTVKTEVISVMQERIKGTVSINWVTSTIHRDRTTEKCKDRSIKQNKSLLSKPEVTTLPPNESPGYLVVDMICYLKIRARTL